MEHMADSAIVSDALLNNRLTRSVDPASGFAVQFADKSTFVSPGLTKREYFAAMAMQSALSDEHIAKFPPAFIADLSVKHADALIEALNK
jgi:hypothetical protein